MKKILAIVLVTLLVLSGCSSKPQDKVLVGEENAEFTALLDRLVTDAIAPSDISINFTFINPEKFGVEREPYDLGFTTKEDFEASIPETEVIIEELSAFKDEDLSLVQQIDRDALIDTFERSLTFADYYDYEVGSSVLGFSRAFMGNVPAYLEKYEFHDETDVIGYLNFIETLEASFKAYVDLEIERQSRGTGYSAEELAKIEEQALDLSNSASAADYYLIEHFNEKLDSVEVDNKDEYKACNKKAINENFSNAYKAIAEGFEGVDAPEMTGLANRPDGKDYYLTLLQSNTGSSRDIKEIEALITRHKLTNSVALQAIATTEEQINDYFNSYISGPEGDFEDGRALIDYLNENYQPYFPETGPFNYDLRRVDPSMEAGSSPAFYFTPQIDYTDEFKQVIYSVGDFSMEDYKTFGHESTPGHMYQFTNFLNSKSHPIRNIYTSSANAEGWANYSEQYVDRILIEEKDQVEFNRAYTSIVQILHIEMDIGINYYGWDYEVFTDFAQTNFGISDDETLKDIYLNFVHNPASYPTYYLSQLYIEDLKTKYFQAHDDTTLDKEFHEAFLKYGSTGFDVIEEGFKKALKK